MKRVVLKGKGKQYYLELNSDSDFKQILQDLQQLLVKLKLTAGTGNQEQPQITVDSQRRLLTSSQQEQLITLLAKFNLFAPPKIKSSVLDRQQVETYLANQKLNIETKVIRSGQVRDYQGDLLLLGTVHQSAQIRTTGNIYIAGQVEGILQAGFPDHSDAVIIGNICQASQVRISDVISIVADLDREHLSNNSLFYINDLHTLVQDTMDHLALIKSEPGIILD
ncbi:hypothetical protein HU830_00375 [Lactobacillus sp. DCY120]|uniref:Septum site-determining protein MinC n=1 Tax=Bombilactobacillus apium TaxID=2675299 RepID=A0A850QV61_9LACO|nr:septum site-determining protein MinC [Bombilactobacillus apium]NVY95664.1 hypothetical protein [Bombilactobacillus apium]